MDSKPITFVIRHTEPTDAEAIARMSQMPRIVWGKSELPYQGVERVI